MAFCFGGAATALAVTFLNAASASVRASLSVLGRLGVSDMLDSFKQGRRQITFRERRHHGKNRLASAVRMLADLQRRGNRRAGGNASRDAFVARQGARGLDRGRAVDLDDLVDHG